MSSSPGTLIIPAPVANPGGKISVLNYRRKPERWETGRLIDALYRPAYVAVSYDGKSYQVQERWTYEVWIEREHKTSKYGKVTGGGYRITVGYDQIRRIK